VSEILECPIKKEGKERGKKGVFSWSKVMGKIQEKYAFR